MDKYQKLFADHAHWADTVRYLKAAGEAEAAKCSNWPNEACISLVYSEVGSLNGECMPYDGYSFDEVWESGTVMVCDHCRNVRDLKAQRMAAIRKLGGIRAAITRMGRALNAKEANSGISNNSETGD